MAKQQPKTGFGKRDGNESVSEQIRNYLITLGLNKMAEPVRLLTKWLTDQPSEPVTVVSSQRLTAERAAKLLSEVGVESKVIDSKDKLSDESACVLTIPPLCERLEDLPLITEVVIVENLKNYSREIEGIHPSHIPVLYFLCHKYKSGAGLHTPILNEHTYAGFLRKALGENLFDKTANELVKYSFQDGEREETKDTLRPFILLEDKRIEFYLNDLPNASQYGIEDRQIAASLIEPDDPDPISGIRPPHPGRVRSVASTEYRLFAEANLSKKDCNGRKLVAIENLQQRMIKIGAMCISQLAKLKIAPILGIFNRRREAVEALTELKSSVTTIQVPHNEFKFVKVGEYWEIVFRGKKTSLRGMVGMDFISFLLKHPGRGIDVSALSALRDGHKFDHARDSLSQMSHDELDEIGLRKSGLDDPYDLVDRKTIDEVTKKISEIEERIEANSNEQPQQLIKDKRMQKQLDSYLRNIRGYWGKSRKVAHPIDKSRQRVKKAVTRAINKTMRYDPDLFKHLKLSIKTGTFCSYEPVEPIEWVVIFPHKN